MSFTSRIALLLGLVALSASEVLAQSTTPVYTTPYTFTTLAGQNSNDYKDGTGTQALFNQPTGIAVDSSGNVYVADSYNYVIRKITPSGVSTTIAGKPGVTGNTDGVGNAASFGQVQGLAIDSAGILYVTDITYNTIRKLTNNSGTWTVSTFVSSTGGLSNPYGIAIDPSGNIYVADTGNLVIRKISSTGAVSTIAGYQGRLGGTDGTGTAATFSGPLGIATDTSGTIYVADSGGDTIRKVTPTGTVTTLGGFVGAPGFLDGPLNLNASQFSHPYAIVVDANKNIYISDGNNNSYIRQISAAGIVSTIGGSGFSGTSDGTGSQASFLQVFGLALDSAGKLYVANSGIGTIRIGTLATSNSTPVITTNPANQNATAGFGVTLQVQATGSGPLSYQWYFNSTALTNSSTVSGATGTTLVISNFTSTSAGQYYVIISNAYGSVKSSVANVAIPITITTQPISQNALIGGSVTLTAVATGSSPTYQWNFNGTPIIGATSASYTASNIQSSAAGSYTLTVTNAVSTATSQSAILTLLNPLISTQPQSQSAPLGGSTTLSVTATGAGLTYQWNFNGKAIVGASTSSYTITNLQSSNTGSYTVTISNSFGSVTSSPAVISLGNNPGRLINLSVLTLDGPGSQLLTVGFVTGGLGTTGSQNLLIRASGPALATYGVTTALADPSLTVFNGSTATASNDNWASSAANQTAVTAADTATQAFPLTDPTSLDAALVVSLPTSGYSIQVAGKGASTGNVLAEIYDATVVGSYTSQTPRLINVSCLQQVSQNGILSAGFVIGGATPLTVLIRVSGPTLSAFGVLNVMPDPTLTVFTGSTQIAKNSGWASTAANQSSVMSAEALTNAFTYTSMTSHDAAIVLTLNPGSYTVQATSASGVAGNTLIEIYSVP